MEVIVDKDSGFCFGVKRAIEMAEQEVSKEDKLFCLGDIVHNTEEVKRLSEKGIEFITHKIFLTLKNCRVLIRAHGEPPETYKYARQNNIELIDATCPVVLKLQEKVRNAQKMNPYAQIVIFGRKDHPEIIGLYGQVKNAIIIQSLHDIDAIDFLKPIFLFAQTTKDTDKYNELKDKIAQHIDMAGGSADNFIVYDSICGQVVDRASKVKEFSKKVDTLIFVGGKTSANSRILFDICKHNNKNSYFVTSVDDVEKLDLKPVNKIGVCGATSTPLWLIVRVRDFLRKKFS
jgi:4-hydroxy-3-methylbut-2-enyl diphosphate reductase